MNREQAMVAIAKALMAVLDKEVEFGPDADLIKDEILDSLDAAVFIFELESLTGRKVPEGDLDELGLYKVSNLVTYLIQ
jgi:acyl carrier protein